MNRDHSARRPPARKTAPDDKKAGTTGEHNLRAERRDTLPERVAPRDAPDRDTSSRLKQTRRFLEQTKHPVETPRAEPRYDTISEQPVAHPEISTQQNIPQPIIDSGNRFEPPTAVYAADMVKEPHISEQPDPSRVDEYAVPDRPGRLERDEEPPKRKRREFSDTVDKTALHDPPAPTPNQPIFPEAREPPAHTAARQDITPPQRDPPLPADPLLSAVDTPLLKEDTPRAVPNPPGRLRHDSEPPASPKKTPKRNPPISASEGYIAPPAAPQLEVKDATDTRSAPASAVRVETRNHQSSASERRDTAKIGKLRFSENESAVNTAEPDKLPPAAAGDKKLENAQRKAGRSAEKLAAAERKLPQRRPTIRRAIDEKNGKPKSRLVFEGEVKSRRAHMSGPLITRPAKIGFNNAVAFGHRKIYQVEHENVGIQAAHKAEILAEGGIRGLLRMRKSAPYRRVERLGRRTAKLNNKVSYQKAISDNPKLRSNIVSRMAQKRRIKKKYAKAAREARKTGTRIKNAADVTEKTVTATARFVARHPLLFLVIGLLALLVAMIAGLFTSCSDMASGVGAAVTGTSYLAEDADINNAELFYTEWETDLRIRINSAENDYPGYHEYRYHLGAIGHDPSELMAYLTAVYQDFTYPGMEAALRELFREQYQLSFTPSVETRYGDPNDQNADGDYEPYDWHILTVTLISKQFDEVIHLTEDQLPHYEILLQSKGNRQYAGSPFAFDWLPNVTSYYGYRVHPISGAKDCHMGIDIGVPIGTDVIAAHNGIISVGNDPGGYGIYVTLTGENGLVTKYGHLDSVVAGDGQSVSVGEVIAKSGNTGSSTGPHLHYEVLVDGVCLNPAYFSVVNGSFISMNQ